MRGYLMDPGTKIQLSRAQLSPNAKYAYCYQHTILVRVQRTSDVPQADYGVRPLTSW